VSKKHKTPDEEYWQEIFDSIDMEFLPVEYINTIIIKFENGTVWDINVKQSRSNQSIEAIEDALNELFEEYEDNIVNIDFRMDMNTLKTKLSKRVRRFLKLNK
jgi:hypothetical protein